MTRLKVVVLVFAMVFLCLIAPLVLPIAMGGVLAVLFSPWMDFLEKKKIPSLFSSFLLTFGMTVVLIVPIFVLVFFSAKTVFQELQGWSYNLDFEKNGILQSFLEVSPIHSFLLSITHRIPIEMNQLMEAFGQLIQSVGSHLSEYLRNGLRQLPGIGVSLLMIVVSVYFFLIERKKIIQFFLSHSLFSIDQTKRLLESIEEICCSVVLASLVSGAIQALLEFFACVFTGTAHVGFIACLVFVSSFIPLVGSAPITLSVAIQQFYIGEQWRGCILLGMCFFLFALDNAIRPFFLRGTTNMHPFLGFIAAFGALQTVGFLGVFLGPILAALCVALFQIFESGTE